MGVGTATSAVLAVWQSGGDMSVETTGMCAVAGLSQLLPTRVTLSGDVVWRAAD
jgi:hypothetical protein